MSVCQKEKQWSGMETVFLPVFKKNKRAFIKYVDNHHLVEIKLRSFEHYGIYIKQSTKAIF